MFVGAIVQARMSSSRFPGKVLHNVNSKPLLKYLFERIDKCLRVDNVIVATSTHKSDDPIVQFCQSEHISYHRGPLKNVAGRFFEVLEANPFDAFVRICADRPLLDQQLVDEAINLFCANSYDIVTNALYSTFPTGQTVEVLDSKIFKESYLLMRSKEDLEHVTKYFYRNSGNYRIHNFYADQDHSEIHLSVDTLEDMQVFTRLIERFDRPHWEYSFKEVIALYDEIRYADTK